jgi:hypothetical protein
VKKRQANSLTLLNLISGQTLRMGVLSPSTYRGVSEPMSLKGWQVVITTLGLLWIYRSTLAQSWDYPFNWPAWLTWFFLIVVFKLRVSHAVYPAFSTVHTFARASAGAVLLVALSSVSILQSGTVSALSLFILITLAISFYFTSSLVISFRAPQPGVNGIERPSFAQSLDVWLPIGLGTVLMRDLRIIRFALWPARRLQSDVKKTGPAMFSNHFVARPMLMALLAIAAVELAVGHILLRSLSPWISFTHLAFGGFFVFYVIGIIRSFTALPTMMECGLLRVRMSVFFDAVTPVSNIRAVSRIATMPNAGDDNIANAAILVPPNILIELLTEIEVVRLFKPRMSAKSIALYVDDPELLIVAVSSAEAFPT